METCKGCSAPERRRPALPNAKKLGGVTWPVRARPTGLPARAGCVLPHAARPKWVGKNTTPMRNLGVCTIFTQVQIPKT